MRSLFVGIGCLLAGGVSHVRAFTNGTLLPQYLCGPANDGEPKSVGTILPYFKLQTFPGTNVANIPLLATDQASVLNTQLLIAGFHNGDGSIKANTHEITITIQASGADAPLANTVYPGRDHVLTLISSPAVSPTTGLPVPDNTIAVDGALIYALDQSGQRVGSFTQVGAQMQVFAGCGPLSAGVVHTGLLSGTAANPLNTYTGLVWHAPSSLRPGGSVTFKGAAVTDGILNGTLMTQGFGPHATTWPTAQQPTTTVPIPPSITKIIYNGTQAAIFFVDENLGGLGATLSYQISYGVANAAANPLTTVGPSSLPLGTSAVAASVTLSTTLTTVTAVSSPIFLSISSLLTANTVAGGLFAVQIVAVTPFGTSLPSNQVSFAVGTANPNAGLQLYFARNYVTPFYPPAVPIITPISGTPAVGTDLLKLAYPVTGLCDSLLQKQLTTFFQYWALDLDKGCAYLTTLLQSQPAWAKF